jgi:hypothetical protein
VADTYNSYNGKIRDQKRAQTGAGKSIGTGPIRREVPSRTMPNSFVQEDFRRTARRTTAFQPTSFILGEDPGKPASPTRNIESRLERKHSETEVHLLPVLFSRQPEYYQLPQSTLNLIAFFTWSFSPVTLTYVIEANPWRA